MDNMKKLLSVFLTTILTTITLVGCSSTYDEVKPKAGSSQECLQECFVYVRYDRTLGCNIVYDNSTKVMYAAADRSDYNRGSLTVLVDENGKPKLYKGK